MMPKPIYCNLDKLELSCQGAVPPKMQELLQQAKDHAQQEKACHILTIGTIRAAVEPKAKGSYTFCFNTGETGATVFVSKNTNPANYNIRIFVSSACLATKGFEGALSHIREICNSLGAQGIKRNPHIKQEPFETLVESISRVDFCMDVVANDFEILRERVIAHSRAQKKFFVPEMQIVERGKNTESLTIGKANNKQVCVYNKTKELAAHQKNYWYDIWAKTAPVLGATAPEMGDNNTVWRFEVRVGKDALYDAGITTFRQLKENLPALYAAILEQNRLAADKVHGKNLSRWQLHPLWALFQEKVIACFENETVTMPSTIVTDKLLEERILMMRKSIYGHLISFAALIGVRLDSLAEVIASIGEDIVPYIEANPIAAADKYRQAQERYANL